MIYTVTFNPSLDYIVTVNDFRLGETNRTASEQMLPGGKGINVSTVLENLGFDNTALGFVAGFTGREIVSKVQELGFQSEFIELDEGWSRINIKMKDFDGTEINGQGPAISEAAVKALLEKLDGLKEGDILVLAGSIPASIPETIYAEIMKRLDGKGVLTVVDATNDLLMEVLPYHPFLIKPNQHELGAIFGVELDTQESVVPYARKMQERGALNVLVSMGGKGAVLLDADGEVHMLPAPEGTLVNAVGAGDSMVAGFLAGWLEKKDYEHAFRMGVSAGSASAFSERLATRAEVETLYRSIEDGRK
ncbi:1-phosphofructokinase [Drancourtella massiliensis]|uniref:Tagatose-6-phosphate kinase n=2 Tax=Clostridia TaxID=186801 RepID=A0A9W6C891_9FIRM|nr:MULTISPECIES: 1-phosphofructokinase [Clostridia]MBM6744905.1 1-phosphofructokinase [Drancourtella massiliensis]OUN70731.1 1-phosphofructokinase [Drancourtella sp. An57]GLG05219.1 tagatose-6-phosphate kinase [Sellimonas catena]